MKNIVRYNDKIRQIIGSKVKPEPWLHCAIVDGCAIIYVWDTRQIVDANDSGTLNEVVLVHASSPAKDNHKPLVGHNASNWNAMLFSSGRHTAPKAAKKQHYYQLKHGDNNDDWNWSAADFMDACKHYHEISPAARKSCAIFVRNMNEKYGRGRHSYAAMLQDAKSRRK